MVIEIHSSTFTYFLHPTWKYPYDLQVNLRQILLQNCENLEDTVSKQCENYKVDGRPHARLHSSLRANTVVHNLIPVLASQDLRKHIHKHTAYHPQN